MAIDLREFASGDTDYIAKMNSNVAALEEAINALQTQIGALPGASTSGFLMDTLFNHADALIGPGSYKPTAAGTAIKVAPGGAYLVVEQKCVQSFGEVSISFSGKPTGTYYLVVGAEGYPKQMATPDPGSIYSVYWNGSSGFSAITKLVPVYFDTVEAEASRSSAQLAKTYTTLDARLEAGETFAKQAKDIAEETLAFAYELEDQITFAKADPPPVYRKIGCSVGTETGELGAIQVDFAGTIIGWSVIADLPGTLTVQIERKASSAPPAAPAIPTSADKISASTPVALAGTQSASRGTAGVATWAKDLKPWDVVQFRALSATGFTRATLYLRILQAPRETGLSMPHLISGVDLNDPLVQYGPSVVANEL